MERKRKKQRKQRNKELKKIFFYTKIPVCVCEFFFPFHIPFLMFIYAFSTCVCLFAMKIYVWRQSMYGRCSMHS